MKNSYINGKASSRIKNIYQTPWGELHIGQLVRYFPSSDSGATLRGTYLRPSIVLKIEYRGRHGRKAIIDLFGFDGKVRTKVGFA